MNIIKRWLIVRANGALRVTTRRPSLRYDEISFRLNITIPASWGCEAGTVDLSIPEGTVIVQPEEMEGPEIE
ncbi:hypothetical protein LCGC14_1486060 [marine sediment metagenome]|uniref:Uncharacterized protein n=1 Tax=marine sediment metagenome TaxID=412755 RepID=A0A0F9J8T5_9ZZZZ